MYPHGSRHSPQTSKKSNPRCQGTVKIRYRHRSNQWNSTGWGRVADRIRQQLHFLERQGPTWRQNTRSWIRYQVQAPKTDFLPSHRRKLKACEASPTYQWQTFYHHHKRVGPPPPSPTPLHDDVHRGDQRTVLRQHGHWAPWHACHRQACNTRRLLHQSWRGRGTMVEEPHGSMELGGRIAMSFCCWANAPSTTCWSPTPCSGWLISTRHHGCTRVQNSSISRTTLSPANVTAVTSSSPGQYVKRGAGRTTHSQEPTSTSAQFHSITSAQSSLDRPSTLPVFSVKCKPDLDDKFEAIGPLTAGPEEKWNCFKEVVAETARTVLGPKENLHQDWFYDNDETVRALQDWPKLLLTARQTQGLSNQSPEKLRSMQDRWWEQKAEELQLYADTNYCKMLYSAKNAIYGPSRSGPPHPYVRWWINHHQRQRRNQSKLGGAFKSTPIPTIYCRPGSIAANTSETSTRRPWPAAYCRWNQDRYRRNELWQKSGSRHYSCRIVQGTWYHSIQCTQRHPCVHLGGRVYVIITLYRNKRAKPDCGKYDILVSIWEEECMS